MTKDDEDEAIMTPTIMMMVRTKHALILMIATTAKDDGDTEDDKDDCDRDDDNSDTDTVM